MGPTVERWRISLLCGVKSIREGWRADPLLLSALGRPNEGSCAPFWPFYLPSNKTRPTVSLSDGKTYDLLFLSNKR